MIAQAFGVVVHADESVGELGSEASVIEEAVDFIAEPEGSAGDRGGIGERGDGAFAEAGVTGEGGVLEGTVESLNAGRQVSEGEAELSRADVTEPAGFDPAELAFALVLLNAPAEAMDRVFASNALTTSGICANAGAARAPAMTARICFRALWFIFDLLPELLIETVKIAGESQLSSLLGQVDRLLLALVTGFVHGADDELEPPGEGGLAADAPGPDDSGAVHAEATLADAGDEAVIRGENEHVNAGFVH